MQILFGRKQYNKISTFKRTSYFFNDATFGYVKSVSNRTKYIWLGLCNLYIFIIYYALGWQLADLYIMNLPLFYSFLINISLLFLFIIVILIVHEFCHMILCFIKKQKILALIFLPYGISSLFSIGACVYLESIPRKKYEHILIVVMPLIVLSGIPTIIMIASGKPNIVLLLVALTNIGISCYDILNAILLIFTVPNNAYIIDNTYVLPNSNECDASIKRLCIDLSDNIDVKEWNISNKVVKQRNAVIDGELKTILDEYKSKIN